MNRKGQDKPTAMREFNSGRFFNVFHTLSFVLVAGAIILTVNLHQRQQALVDAREKTRILLEHNLAIHTYFGKQLKPKVFKLVDTAKNSNYFEPAWMSSTFAVREIDKYYKNYTRENYFYKECAVNARSPENEADDFERSFINELKQDVTINQRSVVRSIDGKPYFVLIRRGESMDNSCLKCHSHPQIAPADLVERYGPTRSFNRSDGELVSAISIRIPLADAYAAANIFSLKLSILLLVILGLTFGIQYILMHRLYFKPLMLIRNKVQSIIDDETKLGEEISTASRSREVNDLTRAFNVLSSTLRSEKDGLVAQVLARTNELAEKVVHLETALSRVKKLEGIITICGRCKQICDDKESWHQLEAYISEHSELFSHGLCPDCFDIEMKGLKDILTDKLLKPEV